MKNIEEIKQEAREELKEKIGSHTHGLPDGYENWENYYSAFQAFLDKQIDRVAEFVRRETIEDVSQVIDEVRTKHLVEFPYDVDVIEVAEELQEKLTEIKKT